MKTTVPIFAAALLAANAYAINPDADSLLGIHWYASTDSIAVGQATDVEDMADGTGIWITEITHVDSSVAPPWDQPGYFVGHSQKAMTGKGHSMIFRIQPYWDRNVIHPADPYTLSNFASDAQAAAQTLQDYVRVWQVGNEVNIRQENRRWNTTTEAYDLLWEPTPAQYSETYIAVRDAIHQVTPTPPLGPQIVLMQAVSPGPTDAWRYMDGNEFLYRMIDAVEDKSKIDGFALHGYAEPGGLNYGVQGFMDAITEQLAIIDYFGLGDRPIFITEFNKHMPNATEAQIGARFLHRAYQAMHDWNTGTGGLWPGQPNHNIRAATWFVYHPDRWQDYSLGHWKTQIASTDHQQNPWYSFQYAAGQNHPAGIEGGGADVPMDELWWQDLFTSLQTTGGPPNWYVETTGAGSAAMSGATLRLRGNNSSFGGATLRTRGLAYSDFRAEVDFTVLNGATATGAAGEANFDIRIREGSRGYSLTFYPAGSNQRANQVWLRRTNNWGENVGGFNASIPGGIANGDNFKVRIVADGDTITYKIFKNDDPMPAIDWTLNDSAQKVGYLRLGTYNVNEVQMDRFAIGGLEWSGTPATSSITNWQFY